MLSLLKAWWRVLLNCRTPLIIPLDFHYRELTKDELESLRDTTSEIYQKDIFDCDDFAFMYKAQANHRRLNGVGVVFGYWRGIHSWNVVLCEGRAYQVEPQTGEYAPHLPRYYPLMVIV